MSKSKRDAADRCIRLADAGGVMLETLKSVLADIEGGMVTEGTVNEIKAAIAKAEGRK